MELDPRISRLAEAGVDDAGGDLHAACGRGRGRLAVACAGARGRSDVKRRLKVETDGAARRQAEAQPKKNANAVREKAVRTAQEFYAKSDPENVARLRMKLIQAGYMDPRAVGTFFLIRFGGFAAFALVAIPRRALGGERSLGR